MKKRYMLVLAMVLVVAFALGKQYSERSGLFKSYAMVGKVEIYDANMPIQESPNLLRNLMVDILNL